MSGTIIATKPRPRKGKQVKKKAVTTASKRSLSIVNQCVHGQSDLPTHKLIDALTNGLPVEELEELRRFLGLSLEKIIPMMGISIATFHRKKEGGKLSATTSDRIIRFARLLGKALEVFESLENAQKWMDSPQVGLSGKTPLHYAETEVGAREVEDLLGRIEFGVYS